MSNYLNIDLPTFWCFLDTGFLYDKQPNVSNERIPVEVFSFTSIPQRCGMFSIMTEYGSQHARVPIHYLRGQEEKGSEYPLDWIQLWDSLSYYVSCNINEYTKNRAANIMLKDHTFHRAKYLFTLDWCYGPQYKSGYGEMAAGHKCGHCFMGEGGQIFIQPQPYPSWTLGEDYYWNPPIPVPVDNVDKQYIWNESNLSWDMVE